jgi:peptide/nickel transport system substrate-binding protein
MMLDIRKTTLAFGLTLGWLALPALAQDYKEPPLFADLPQDKKLPPIVERLPKTPIVVGSNGQYGGDIVTLVPRPRDIRYISTFTYTRLVGYDRNLNLQPDLLEKLDNEDDRVFTFTLRAGHRWSDGSPFTAEDFRYYWEDVAHNLDLSPAGPPEFMLVD